jgi:hypothetical protein
METLMEKEKTIVNDKVFCDNCLYEGSYYDYCNYKVIENKYTKVWHYLHTRINENGQCKFYKKKWWKIRLK